MKMFGIVLALISGIALLIAFFNRDRLKLLYASLNAFRNENLSYSFQHMAEIFHDADLSVSKYLDKTKTLGFLVIQDNVIRHESYSMGADENTLFSSNSMGKSFVSALMICLAFHAPDGRVAESSQQP